MSDLGITKNNQDNIELLRRRTEELQVLVQVAQLIHVVDLDYVLSHTLQLMTNVSGANKGSLFLLDSQQKPFQRFLTQRHMSPEITRQVARDVVEKGLAGWCIEHKKGDVVDDIETDARWHVFPDDEQKDVRSALCVPLFLEDQAQGVITLVNSNKGHFDASHLQLITAVANQATTVIRNAQLFDELQTKQKQFELVINTTTEPLLTVDADLVVTLANPEAKELIKLTQPDAPTDLVGQKLLNLGGSDSVYSKTAQRIQKSQDGMESLSFELSDEKNKRSFVISVAAMLRDSNQEVIGYVITIHDITTIREYDTLKTQMLHMLTHDIKNPMNVIWGYLDLMRIDKQQGKGSDERFIDGMLRSLQKMENLVDETLSAFRLMEIHGADLHEQFSPKAIIKTAINETRDDAKKKSLAFMEEVDEEFAPIEGTPFQLREAMINLINNAIKYTETGTITVKATVENERLYFSVKDTGIGIPLELQKQLFSKFYRAKRPEVRDIAGTGLGLNLVKGVVENHQGQVWFESEAGAGSTFGFWVPLAK